MPGSMDTSSRSELNTRIRQQEVVAELGQQALEEDDLDQLMHDAAVAVAETLDNDYCKVLELLPGGDEVFLQQGVGWDDGYIGNATISIDLDSQAGYTLISDEPIIVDDLSTESRFSGPDLLVDHDVVSGISVIIGSVEEPGVSSEPTRSSTGSSPDTTPTSSRTSRTSSPRPSRTSGSTVNSKRGRSTWIRRTSSGPTASSSATGATSGSTPNPAKDRRFRSRCPPRDHNE